MTAKRLRIVPSEPAPVEVYAQLREEIRTRDWHAMHLAGDRNPPIQLRESRWRWSLPLVWGRK